jgi:hypothetical protein
MFHYAAVRTGNEMIIWGGQGDQSNHLNTGRTNYCSGQRTDSPDSKDGPSFKKMQDKALERRSVIESTDVP